MAQSIELAEAKATLSANEHFFSFLALGVESQLGGGQGNGSGRAKAHIFS